MYLLMINIKHVKPFLLVVGHLFKICARELIAVETVLYSLPELIFICRNVIYFWNSIFFKINIKLFTEILLLIHYFCSHLLLNSLAAHIKYHRKVLKQTCISLYDSYTWYEPVVTRLTKEFCTCSSRALD